jgi:hypothetical protein
LKTKISKLLTTLVTALLIISIAIIPMQVQAQEEPHGGVGNGYEGPSTAPSNVTPNIQVITTAYLALRPNPIGVGQSLLINVWITPPPSADRYMNGFVVTITKPDGSIDTIKLNSYVADGTSWSEYKVDQAGTWKIKFDFIGEYFPAGNYSNGALISTRTGTEYASSMYYQPSTSGEESLTVQQDMVASYPPAALPTGYWTRPISPENREWYTISGPYPWPFTNWGQDWMGPWVTGPTSAHIVWNKVLTIGGITGGDTGATSLTTTPGYPTVIYAGRAYQTYSKPGVGSVAACYDIRTGQVFYEKPIDQGGVTPVIVSYIEPSKTGIGAVVNPTYELLSGTIANGGYRQLGAQLIKIDPLTGSVTTNVTCLSGTFYNGHFVLSVQTNNTAAGNRLINWTTAGTSSNFTSRIISNTTFALTSLPALCDFELSIGVVINRFQEGSIYGGNLVAVSLQTGNVVWNITTGTETPYNGGCASIDNGKLAVCFEDRFWNCYDLRTGKLLWKSELLEFPWGDFWSYDASSWNGMIYAGSYVGMVAFDWNTGKIVWQTKAYSAPFETPYNGEQAFHSATIVADGKLYSYSDEHTATQPLTRGWKWYCWNATTGEEIWSIKGWNSDARTFSGSVSDGYLAAADQYSGTLQVFGIGQSATTITASPKISALGDKVLLEGTVLDQSPAQPDTPCVSKDSMALQMEYLHMQTPIDGIWHNQTITGVPVSLDTVDPNGNAVHIADITTDGYSGTFGYAWKPEISGQYTVTATFLGDDSYGSSFATTYANVGEAPAPTATIVPLEKATDYTMTIVASAIAVIIAVAIVGAILMASVRKR